MILAARGRTQREDANPTFLLRNPARDKAEATLHATEQKLLAAEECASSAVDTRERARGMARAARERLEAAETAYVQVLFQTQALSYV